jgi:hypothetical protein
MLNELDFLKLPCPKLSWDKKTYKLVLYYYVGEDYGICQFKFDYYEFVALYERCKGYYKLSDEGGPDGRLSYSQFMKELGASDRASKILGMLLKFYCLNPTVCKKAIHQDKKRGHKISLSLKKGIVDKAHGISKPRGKHGAGRLSGKDKLSSCVPLTDEDRAKADTIMFLMNSCVDKAAKTFSMQPFMEYLSLYADLQQCLHQGTGFISKSKENALFKEFGAKVKKLQKR